MKYYNNMGFTITPDSNYNTLEDFGKWLTSSQKKPEAKPIEYAFKDEVDYLKRIVNEHDVAMDHCLQAIEVNRKDCEQMYQAIDTLKHDAQQVKQIVNYLYNRVESAPSVTKRKRKVTICASGQIVDIKRA